MSGWAAARRDDDDRDPTWGGPASRGLVGG
jgi:hypothetical protein